MRQKEEGDFWKEKAQKNEKGRCYWSGRKPEPEFESKEEERMKKETSIIAILGSCHVMAVDANWLVEQRTRISFELEISLSLLLFKVNHQLIKTQLN